MRGVDQVHNGILPGIKERLRFISHWNIFNVGGAFFARI